MMMPTSNSPKRPAKASYQWTLLRSAACLVCAVILFGISPAAATTHSPSPASQIGDTTTSTGSAALAPVAFLPMVAADWNPSDYYNCRLGIGVARNALNLYQYRPLHFGWSVNWGAETVAVPGIEFYRTVRVKQDRSADGTYLPTYKTVPDLSEAGIGGIAQKHPGSLWLIGNEPDRVGPPEEWRQDDSLPEKYAEIYHDVYTYIRRVDPTARFAIAGVVQPTPVRLQYLDRVLAAYQAKYGHPMPIDVWNVHLYLIREFKNDWGADIPPGIDALVGRDYSLQDHVNAERFRELTVEFRTWMKARGFQDKPLIVTEFGLLMPLWFLDDDPGEPITQERVNTYLRDIIMWMNSASDPQLGYPADGYHLVQRAALYSLDDDRVFEPEPPDYFMWGSFVFRSTSPYDLTETGVYYRDNIAGQISPTVDLAPIHLSIAPHAAAPGQGVRLTAMLANSGNSRPDRSVRVRFFDTTSGTRVYLGDVLIPAFTGCGSLQAAQISWPALTPGWHEARVEVNPEAELTETDRSNNILTERFYVYPNGYYLPLLASQGQ